MKTSLAKELLQSHIGMQEVKRIIVACPHSEVPKLEAWANIHKYAFTRRGNLVRSDGTEDTETAYSELERVLSQEVIK